jgi:hypothetical protein
MSDPQETVEEKQEKQEKQEKPKKAQKEAKPKKVVLRMLKTTEHVPATRWTTHLHRIIKEANPSLLKDPAVIHAFHALIEVLLKHQEHVYGFGPCNRKKYEFGLNLDAHPEDPLRDICEVRWKSVYYDQESGRPVIRSRYYQRLDGSPEREFEVRDEIIRVYRVLFDLIKADILPYMSHMVSENGKREKNKMIQHIMERMERLQMIHDHTIERNRETIQKLEEHHERRMNECRDMIARLSTDV